MLWLAVRPPFTNQLGKKTRLFANLAAHQPDILDARSKAMRLHQVSHVDQPWEDQPAPLDTIAAPANAAGVVFALDTVQLIFTFEADALCLPKYQAIGCLVGPRGQLLRGQAVEMLANPGLPDRSRVDVQIVFPKVETLARLGKKPLALRIVWGQGSRPLEELRLTHQRDSPLGFAQAGVVHLARSFQPGKENARIRRGNLERDFANEGRCSFTRLRFLLWYCHTAVPHRVQIDEHTFYIHSVPAMALGRKGMMGFSHAHPLLHQSQGHSGGFFGKMIFTLCASG